MRSLILLMILALLPMSVQFNAQTSQVDMLVQAAFADDHDGHDDSSDEDVYTEEGEEEDSDY